MKIEPRKIIQYKDSTIILSFNSLISAADLNDITNMDMPPDLHLYHGFKDPDILTCFQGLLSLLTLLSWKMIQAQELRQENNHAGAHILDLPLSRIQSEPFMHRLGSNSKNKRYGDYQPLSISIPTIWETLWLADLTCNNFSLLSFYISP